ncbi:hypothetical protein O3P69_001672 [Scylla paramamosain]|uniref:Uncharacterized protein n=1 Tax=Scylla paramamosain TaxID=85552 RepID=A0AAW0UZB0_SCYPA
MAINVVFPLLIPLEEDVYNATRLLPGDTSGGPLAFTQARYCVVVAEDAVPSSSLASVRAVHKQGELEYAEEWIAEVEQEMEQKEEQEEE